MIETKVITYQSEAAMTAGIQQMEAEGWKVTNVQEAKEHGASSCLIIIARPPAATKTCVYLIL